MALWCHLGDVAWAGLTGARPGQRGTCDTVRTCPPAVAWPQNREGLGEWGSSPEVQMTSD